MQYPSDPRRRRSSQRGWTDILTGTYRSIEEDRVLAVAAGVTFYGLLAVFPAVGAIVSLYGLVADSSTIRNTLDSLSSFLPAGALEIVGDQIQRVTAAGASTLSFSFRACDRDMGRERGRQGGLRCAECCLRRERGAWLFQA